MNPSFRSNWRVAFRMAFFFAILCALSSSSAYASAPPPQGWNLVGVFGPAVQFDLPHNPATTLVGISLAHVFKSRWEMGGEVEIVAGNLTFGFDLNYFLEEAFFVGIQGGFDIDGRWYPYLGPQVGFDYRINSHFTAGTEIQYLDYVGDIGGVFELLGTVKYYF